MQILFSEQYPMKAPELQFITKIYHPSVQQKDGKVCPEIIGKNWAPVLNIKYSLVFKYWRACFKFPSGVYDVVVLCHYFVFFIFYFLLFRLSLHQS